MPDPNVFAAALLRWYDHSARALPWRSPPGSATRPDPYAVWLSEIMLQQTTVAAVRSYFARFMARWPDVAALAAADDADVMAAWAGLGYYARARNLLACARTVERDHGGRFPDEEPALRALPGVGAYTAAAIAAIAFDRRAVVVDANVERVITRLSRIEQPLPAARPAIRTIADHLTPHHRPGDFAQAMMDLGATLCTPRRPDCARCPVASACAAQRIGDAERFPVKAPKAARPERSGVAYWIEADGAVWLVRRPARGMLGGMRALPGGEWDTDQPLPDGAPRVRHVFTHFALTLAIVRADRAMPGVRADRAMTDQAGEWWPLERIDAAGLPSLYARAVAAFRAAEDKDQ